jgi:YidC/Oxa1 family membrane protein insertase
LVPHDLEKLAAPFSLVLPWAPELADQLNKSNFEISGASEQRIELNPGEQRELTFTYSSGGVIAQKVFKLYADRFIVDVTARVTSPTGEQRVELVLGPRIGDQSDKRASGSYSTPPQVIAYNTQGSREAVVAQSITAMFTKITAVDEDGKRIQVEKPPAEGVDSIRIVAGDEQVLVGQARILGREGATLTLDSLPEGTAAGNGVAQGLDSLKQGYRWVGLVDHYFTITAIPPQPIDEAKLGNVRLKEEDGTVADYPWLSIPVRSDSTTPIFIGPKDRELLVEVGQELNVDLEALIDYGFFAFMVRPIVPTIGWALDGLARVFHNYGWSIVAVTIVINLFLSPLRYYSSKKMKQAAKHQPRLKELQEKMKKLKESPKKSEQQMLELQKEQMALMKEANPLGGCLPMLLQMPIFWAFFIYLTISLDVRHAAWIGWIKDLSIADPYHVLPIIMCVTMIASTKLTPQPASADPAMKMQRIMMTWLMPVMLTWFFFLSAPSGLVLYWMVSNLVGVVVQLVINKITAEPQPVESEAEQRKSGKNKIAKRRPSEKEAVGSAK